ncbi:MAG: glycosyltransferase [Thermodesulfobacteriota bacterium]|nr:glycosyltransferase [Thermodesulfobacteriota bacterium]
MNIGLVNGNPSWGGGEQWFWDACGALDKRGHRLVLAAKQGTRLYELFCNSGHPVYTMKGLGQDFAGQNPEVVLCNSGRDLRQLIRSVPKPMDFRVIMRRGIDRPLNDNFLRRPYWKRLSAILVNSDATGRTVSQSLPWFPEDRIHRIYNPVSLDIEARVEPETQAFRIGTVGRLVKQKGIGFLIRAVSRIGKETDWTLTIAGDGKLRQKLEALAQGFGVGDRCRFLGHVEAIASFYARVDAIVIPSLYEGFCFVAVEAALAGLPVIASNASSLPEIVSDGETGILVPARHVDALAGAIQRLAQDREMAESYGKTARQRAAERFGPSYLHDDLNDFLAMVVHKPPVGKDV